MSNNIEQNEAREFNIYNIYVNTYFGKLCSNRILANIMPTSELISMLFINVDKELKHFKEIYPELLEQEIVHAIYAATLAPQAASICPEITLAKIHVFDECLMAIAKEVTAQVPSAEKQIPCPWFSVSRDADGDLIVSTTISKETNN